MRDKRSALFVLFVTSEEAKIARAFVPQKPLLPSIIYSVEATRTLGRFLSYSQILNWAMKACKRQML